jgi:hypothetical protein
MKQLFIGLDVLGKNLDGHHSGRQTDTEAVFHGSRCRHFNQLYLQTFSKASGRVLL